MDLGMDNATTDEDPVLIDFWHSQACTDRHLFESICNDCWADNLRAFEPRLIATEYSGQTARKGRESTASEAEQLGADDEACYGEQF